MNNPDQQYTCCHCNSWLGDGALILTIFCSAYETDKSKALEKLKVIWRLLGPSCLSNEIKQVFEKMNLRVLNTKVIMDTSVSNYIFLLLLSQMHNLMIRNNVGKQLVFFWNQVLN